MADLVITAASVVKTSTTVVLTGIAGGTVTAGQPVYKDSSDSNSLKAGDADVSATSDCVGIALHGAADGQPLAYATRGDLTIGAVAAVGQVYVVSTNPGGIAPYSDLASGDFVCILGVATTTSNLKIGILSTTTAKA